MIPDTVKLPITNIILALCANSVGLFFLSPLFLAYFSFNCETGFSLKTNIGRWLSVKWVFLTQAPVCSKLSGHTDYFLLFSFYSCWCSLTFAFYFTGPDLHVLFCSVYFFLSLFTKPSTSFTQLICFLSFALLNNVFVHKTPIYSLFHFGLKVVRVE